MVPYVEAARLQYAHAMQFKMLRSSNESAIKIKLDRSASFETIVREMVLIKTTHSFASPVCSFILVIENGRSF